ncbi:hypothetical protein HAX54_007923 [Datura stramonium]|uniref:Uncharacterized protein n=1 Tax=Datura stramonium TaxID=4076 RepID=A0ABS8WXI3_DATST|nr:hypothetical protein [Datura stramonium]
MLASCVDQIQEIPLDSTCMIQTKDSEPSSDQVYIVQQSDLEQNQILESELVQKHKLGLGLNHGQRLNSDFQGTVGFLGQNLVQNSSSGVEVSQVQATGLVHRLGSIQMQLSVAEQVEEGYEQTQLQRSPLRGTDQDQSNRSKSKNKLSKKRRDALKKKLEVQNRETQESPALMIDGRNNSSPLQSLNNHNDTTKS